MYTVQVEVLDIAPSITYLPSELAEPEWSDLVTVPQLDSEQDELQEARLLARIARKHYVSVRISKSYPGGSSRIVV